ncbi:hypothetical protein RTG_01010 [Rhodotorula toruloides ATCC 204091]|uniref:Splicing factor 3B subunit 5 n=1 Tax=Rhodotorula toruloides TaxID=5286 RepID=A0A0K3CF13_RHOTO|nr:hypothetical protein RTG_01010 [Rhodotorula toruloides ATCC 204091]
MKRDGVEEVVLVHTARLLSLTHPLTLFSSSSTSSPSNQLDSLTHRLDDAPCTSVNLRPPSRSEWITNQHRDTSSSIVGHPALLQYLAIADGETTARTKFELTERMLQPCGPPPPKEDD